MGTGEEDRVERRGRREKGGEERKIVERRIREDRRGGEVR